MCSICWTAEDDEVDEGDEGDDGADVAATYILSYGQNTMGIGYTAVWGF